MIKVNDTVKYKSFTIHKYRGICKPIEITMHKGVYPIIGVNESGKTTILKAISVFDESNDALYETHIQNVGNRQNGETEASVSALLEIQRSIIKNIAEKHKQIMMRFQILMPF